MTKMGDDSVEPVPVAERPFVQTGQSHQCLRQMGVALAAWQLLKQKHLWGKR